jgi:lipid-A-disaccharide synthase-like uncharacterized protein
LSSTLWTVVGGAAQVVFASRFLVQWITSEVQGRSVIPAYFWYASLLGSVGLLAYAIHIRDPIFTLGQSFGLVVYSRNLVLRRRNPVR